MTINEKLWSTFTQEHAPNFSTVVHLRGVVENTSAVTALIEGSFKNATDQAVQNATGVPRIRVFGPEQLDYRASEAITHGGFDGRDLVAWLQNFSSRNDNVCVAFNGLESWSAHMRSFLYREIVEPMVVASGPPPRGLDVYSFIATDGYTPFGIHSDPEPSLIFHLGPNTKTVWVWKQESMSGLPDGRDITLDIADYLNSADHTITLAAGDFLCIPENHFHLFRNNGASIFLGMSYYRKDDEYELIQAILSTLNSSELPDQISFLADAAANGKLRKTLAQRTQRRACHGYMGVHRVMPATAYRPEDAATVTSTPITLINGELSVLGCRVALPDALCEYKFHSLLRPGATVRSEDLSKILGDVEEGRAMFTTLLRTGALTQSGIQK